ncbi:MAG: DMT family transporter [Hydrococcus sp. Prado102]|jgi:drug/metabolite transporter (DMT)-like permease|nr:DMT family transporter [Hydrococcus sp. Prado102]
MVSFPSIYYTRTPNSGRSQGRDRENQPKSLVIIAIIATVLLWASAFPAIRVALEAYTPAEVALLRYIVASAVLIVYALITRISLPSLQDLPLIALCGLIGFTLYNVMLNAGQVTVSAGIASFIISSEVGIIALLAWLFFGERLGKLGWIGVVSCIAGVGIIAFGTGGTFQLSLGVLRVFVATLSISIYSIIQKPLLARYSAIHFTTYAIWSGTLFLFFLAPEAVSSAIHAPIAPTLAVIYMGLFPVSDKFTFLLKRTLRTQRISSSTYHRAKI